MAISKKDLKQAPQATAEAAATYAQDPEQEQIDKHKRQRRGEKLTLTTFACPPQLLATIRRLAHYRQTTSSSLIQLILQEYVDVNHAEIEAFDAVYEKLGKPLPNPTE